MQTIKTVPGKQWYAVYTRPRWEKKVAQQLEKRGIEHYCPINKVVRQWSDRKKMVHEPLFTSYVFVRVAENDQVPVKKTSGVINLVYWLGRPAVIRDIEIEMIQRFMNEHVNVQLERTPVSLNDMVKVISGPLMEQEGKVVAVKSRTVKLVLPSLGYMMSAEVELSRVEVVRKRFEDIHAEMALG